MDFSLRVNRKQIATNSSPYRNQQFEHICSLRSRFQRQGLPIISVDSKKRELIGRPCRWKRLRSEQIRSEEHTSELQSPDHLVSRLLLQKKNKSANNNSLS